MDPSGTLTSLVIEERTRPIRFIKILLFSASIMPVIVAGTLAYAGGYSNLLWLLLAGSGLFLGQAGGDYLYYFYTNFHTDTRDAHTKIFAGWKPLFVGKWIRKENSVYAGFFCLLAALMIGLYFYLNLGNTVLYLALAGGLVAIFFTPLMVSGLKEPVIFMTFGPLSMVGVDYVLTQQIRLEALAASLPVGFLVTVVAYLKGAHYRLNDVNGKTILLNLKPKTAAFLMILAYLSLVSAVLTGFLNPGALLGMLSLPFAWVLYQKLLSYQEIKDYLWATVYGLLVFILTGFCMAGGFLI